MVPSDRLARADPPVSDLSVRILPLAMNQSSSRQNFRLHLLTKSPRILSLFSVCRTTRYFLFSSRRTVPHSFLMNCSCQSDTRITVWFSTASGVVDSRLATILLLSHCIRSATLSFPAISISPAPPVGLALNNGPGTSAPRAVCESTRAARVQWSLWLADYPSRSLVVGDHLGGLFPLIA